MIAAGKSSGAIVGAGVVVLDPQKRLLLVRETKSAAKGLWNIPSGRVEEGETPQEAAIRELREEAGILSTLDGYLGAYAGHIGQGLKVVRHVWYLLLKEDVLPTPVNRFEIDECVFFDRQAVSRMAEVGALRFPHIEVAYVKVMELLNELPET
ncbi:NUDIX domain-containing protein [Rhizobium leguminosarum]|uniref:NUDIX domain-containing protein n=1 Tax=Rhizobium leguminosarum TaxID=384 RepID=UPI00067F4B5B|nr:NUDIX domain-containing protein [Rhizobium leguminosarum]